MNRQTIGRLLSFCRPYMKYLYFALICSSGQIIFTLLIPVFIGQAVDHIIGKGLVEFDLLFQKMLWILMSVIIAEIFDWLVVRLSNLLVRLLIILLERGLLSLICFFKRCYGF